MKTRFILLALLSLGGAGCSSNDIEDRIAQINDAKSAEVDRQQEIREEEIEIAPDWALAPPPSDPTSIYGVGIFESKKLRHAIAGAKLVAEFDLAKQSAQELSGSERLFDQGDAEGNVKVQSTFLIDKLVMGVQVVGYDIVQSQTIALNGVFHSYVMLKMPIGDFNKVLVSAKKDSFDVKVRAAFDDMQRRLNERRIQIEASKEAEFERNRKALKDRAEFLRNDEKPEIIEHNEQNKPKTGPAKQAVKLLNSLGNHPQ